MEIGVASEILEKSGITRDEFASMVGVKSTSMRMTFYNGRFSKKAVARLELLAEDLGIDLEGGKEEARDVKEGMIRQSMGEPRERLGVVYSLPRNPYLRLVEFDDGTHGKFRAKEGRFGLGSKVRLKKGDGDVWELCGEYDRKDRLVGGK